MDQITDTQKIGHSQHVAFTETFLDYFNQDILRTTVLKAYEGLAPKADLEPAFEEEVLKTFAERQILDRLVPKIRTDRLLTINSDGPLISVGMAAQLNQAMVFAVLHAAKQKGVLVRRSSGKIKDVIKHADGLEAVGITLDDASLSNRFHHVILRHGPNKEVRYHPAKEQFDEYDKVSTERFKAKPELFFPPRLDVDTYTLFFELWLQKLADAARREQLAGRSALEASTILVTWDEATQTLVQRGRVLIEKLVTQCESALTPIAVHLAVPPDKIDAADLIRLSKASGGKITLSVGPDVQAAWKPLLSDATLDQTYDLAQRLLVEHGLTRDLAEKWVSLTERLIDDPDSLVTELVQSREAKESVTDGNIDNISDFLKDETWKRNISGLSSYLLLTHFLGQSTLSRLTSRDPGERFDILKEAAESKEIEGVANALHGKGSTKAARAYNSRMKSLNDEAAALQVLLDTEADLWSGLTGVGAIDDAAASEAANEISRLLDDASGVNVSATASR